MNFEEETEIARLHYEKFWAFRNNTLGFFLKIFHLPFFLLVFLCSKGLRIRLFASLSSVSLHQWKVYEPLMFQRGLWGRKREKVTEVSPQRWPKSWCLQKSVRNSNFHSMDFDRFFRLPKIDTSGQYALPYCKSFMAVHHQLSLMLSLAWHMYSSTAYFLYHISRSPLPIVMPRNTIPPM